MKITINVPKSRVRTVKARMREFEIPASQLRRLLISMAEGYDNTDFDDSVLMEHIYPNRETAVRIASAYLRGHGSWVLMHFREKRKVISVYWYTPYGWEQAKKYLSGKYNAGICPGLETAEAA